MPSFEGGLSLRIAPHLIGLDQAVIYENVDNDSAILQPIKAPANVQLLDKPFVSFYTFLDNWVEFDSYVSFVEYRNFAYFTDGKSKLNILPKSNKAQNLLLTAPVSDTTTVTAHQRAAQDIPTVEYTYYITKYNSLTGSESKPIIKKITSKPIEDIENIAEAIKDTYTHINLRLTGTNSYSQATHIKVYRLGNNITKASLVTTAPLQADQDFIAIADNLADDQIESTIFNKELINLIDLPGLKYLTEYRGRLFAAKEDRVYFTDPGEPAIWTAFNFVTIARSVTGLGVSSVGLLIFTASTTEVLLENNGELSLNILSADKGCLGHESVQSFGPNCVWVSENGICYSNGYNIDLLSRERIGKIKFSFTSSAVNYDQYMLQLTDGRIFIVDFVRLLARYENYKADYIVLKHNEPHVIKDKILSKLYTSTLNTNMVYKSGDITSSMLVTKYYNYVLIAFKGDIYVKIFVDEREVYDEVLYSDIIVNKKLKLKANDSKGLYINYEIGGTGTVYSLEAEETLSSLALQNEAV